jgi:hypothetical protein
VAAQAEAAGQASLATQATVATAALTGAQAVAVEPGLMVLETLVLAAMEQTAS